MCGNPIKTSRVRGREDGRKGFRSTRLTEEPDLAGWTPGATPGLTELRELKPRDLEEVEKELLFGAARLQCIDDKDICAAHPELATLGYVDCP